MNAIQMTQAKDAQTLTAIARMKLIKRAVLCAANDQGQSNTFVRFQASGDEIVELMDLGYDVRVSDSGTTHISWFK